MGHKDVEGAWIYLYAIQNFVYKIPLSGEYNGIFSAKHQSYLIYENYKLIPISTEYVSCTGIFTLCDNEQLTNSNLSQWDVC